MNVSEEDFQRVIDMVQSANGVELHPEKAYLAEARLGPLVREQGLDGLGSLLDTARSDAVLRKQITDAMTTDETSFFRDLNPFLSIRDHIIPVLDSRPTEEPIRIWSAACSNGQEPYTLAMTLHARPPRRPWELLATDVSTHAVERTRAGLYRRHEINRGLPASELLRHFDAEGSSYRIRESLRQAIDVREFNLLDPWHELPRVDLLLLRNVMIYFSLETRRRLLDRVTRQLRPGGWLLLGAAETALGLSDDLVPVKLGRSTFFQRREDAP